MTVATFTPPRNPDPGLARKPESKLLEAEFGDGYTQAAGDGINFLRDVATLTWSGLSQAEVDAMFAFWKAQGGGSIPFLYTLPGSSQPIKWTWKDYSQTWSTNAFDGATLYTITATFRQSFNIGAGS